MPIPMSMGDSLGEAAAPLEDEGGDEAGELAAAAFLKAKDPVSCWRAFLNMLDVADASADAQSSQSPDSGLDGAFPPQ